MIQRSCPVVVVALLLSCCDAVDDHPYVAEGRPHAEALVTAVTRDWKADPLLKIADPKLLEVFPEQKLRDLMETCSRELGHPKSQTTLAGSAVLKVGALTGKFAVYLVEVVGERAIGKITVQMHKVGDEWKVVTFWVNIPEPAGHAPAQYRATP